MTRREEIQWEAGGIVNRMIERGFSEHYDTYYQAFQEGAKWADKTMIEKACEWITEHIDIPYEGEFIDDSPVASDYIEWCEKRLEYAKAVADAFKQAMEE